MTFYSIQFLVFFLIMSLLYHYSQTVRQQRWMILLANVCFYGYWDYHLLGLLFAVIGLCYFSALGYSKTHRRVCLTLSVIAVVSVLAVCKYYNFFIDAFCQTFGILNRFSLRIILPLGISFYIFQALSYLFDVKNGTVPAETDFVKLAAYISFFPQIISGPIAKAHDFLPQLDTLHRVKKENLYRGIQLFLLGLTKKIVLADRIGVSVNAVLNTPGAYSGISILFALIGYAMQLYCDFSGYSDMAVGIATVWDFSPVSNFNMPYLARNPSDFWRRWHISLSSWFRDYVYIPLGGSKCKKWKACRNLMITMLLSGLWHGTNWTFLLWGALHGTGAIVHRIFRDRVGRQHPASHPWVLILANNAFVILLWAVFRANTLHDAIEIYAGLFRPTGIHYINVYVAVYLTLMILGNLLAYHRHDGNAVKISLDLRLFRNKLLISIWIFLIIMFAYTGSSAFIYAQF